jgi:hypothetical protein
MKNKCRALKKIVRRELNGTAPANGRPLFYALKALRKLA